MLFFCKKQGQETLREALLPLRFARMTTDACKCVNQAQLLLVCENDKGYVKFLLRMGAIFSADERKK